MTDGRKRTERMPLGTWFWMPFFERKVQIILSKLKKAEDENYALWAYCEIACVVVYRDRFSFSFCAPPGGPGGQPTPNDTGRGAYFECLFNSSKQQTSRVFYAELFLEVEKSHQKISTEPATRHKIAAFSEAKYPNALSEKYLLGKFPRSAKTVNDICEIETKAWLQRMKQWFFASPGDEIDPDEPLGWKKVNFSEASWTAIRAGVLAESERRRRMAVLKRWPLISSYAPKAILMKS